MPITPEEAKPLKEAVGEFVNAAAKARVMESDVLWCEAEGRTPGPDLIELLETYRSKARKAHSRVYGLINDLTEEATA